MYTREMRNLSAQQGLHTMEAVFVTDHMAVQALLSTPEGRLSDHLNSSTTSIEIQPLEVRNALDNREVDLSGGLAHITKSHLLYIVPIAEPARPDSGKSDGWGWTRRMGCWTTFGGYALEGTIHVEAGRDVRLVLRMLEQKQFLPLTQVKITRPNWGMQEHDAVIVNRAHVELLSLRVA